MLRPRSPCKLKTRHPYRTERHSTIQGTNDTKEQKHSLITDKIQSCCLLWYLARRVEREDRQNIPHCKLWCSLVRQRYWCWFIEWVSGAASLTNDLRRLLETQISTFSVRVVAVEILIEIWKFIQKFILVQFWAQLIFWSSSFENWHSGVILGRTLLVGFS